MKLINKGSGEWRPWWLGQRMKCQECGREVELELHDEMSANWRPTLDDSVQISCERCGNAVILNKSKGEAEQIIDDGILIAQAIEGSGGF